VIQYIFLSIIHPFQSHCISRYYNSK